MKDSITVREPLFHMVKRGNITLPKRLGIYAGAIVAGIILTSILCVVASSEKGNPLDMFSSMFSGVFGTERRFWIFLRDTALLLGISLALLPAFKMKFWNLGANGQVLIGCLVTIACMRGLGGKMSDVLIVIIMTAASVAAGAVWALIPAIFKAFFKTNESLFTLMMNYVAQGLVVYMITVWAPGGSGSLSPETYGRLPDIGTGWLSEIGSRCLLTLIVSAALTVFMFFYLTRSKHGYELSVVGESENTARYVGINVKKTVIRTLALSGGICGLMGLLIGGSINYTVSSEIVNNMGFTGIMTSWLAKFNPLVLIGTCALITFVSKGMGQVRQDFGFYNDAIGNVVLGIIYFFIIGCEFFITYKLISRRKNRLIDLQTDGSVAKKEEEGDNE